MPMADEKRPGWMWKLAGQFCAGFPSIRDEADPFEDEEEAHERERVQSPIEIERHRIRELAEELDTWIEAGKPEDGEYFEASPEETYTLRDALLGAFGYLDFIEARAWSEICARRAAPGSRYKAFANAMNFVTDEECGRGRKSQRDEYQVARAYLHALKGTDRELRSPWGDESIGRQRVVELPPPPLTAAQACSAVEEFFEFPSYAACRSALIRIREKVIEEWKRIEALKQDDSEQGWREWRSSWRAKLIKDPKDFPVPAEIEPRGDK
jgi:hypothetical protein